MYEKTYIKDYYLSLEDEISLIKINGNIDQTFLENLGSDEAILDELNEYEKRLILWSIEKNKEVLEIHQVFKDEDYRYNDQLLEEMVGTSYKKQRAKELLYQSLCRRFPGYKQFEIRKGFVIIKCKKTPEQIKEIKKNKYYTCRNQSRINNSH